MLGSLTHFPFFCKQADDAFRENGSYTSLLFAGKKNGT